MRTIGSTFSSRQEAEAARDRLQGLGVSPDHILLRDLDDASQGIFLGAKVTAEQADAASKALKVARQEERDASAEHEAAPTMAGIPVDVPERDEGFRVEKEPEAAAMVQPAVAAPVAEGPRPIRRQASPEPEPLRRPAEPPAAHVRSATDRGLGRHVMLAGLMVFMAFVLGALLGAIA